MIVGCTQWGKDRPRSWASIVFYDSQTVWISVFSRLISLFHCLNILAAWTNSVLVVAIWHPKPIFDLNNFASVDHVVELRYQNLFCLMAQVQQWFGFREGTFLMRRQHLLLQLDLLQNWYDFSESILRPFPYYIHMPHDISVQINSLYRKSLFKNLDDIVFEHGSVKLYLFRLICRSFAYGVCHPPLRYVLRSNRNFFCYISTRGTFLIFSKLCHFNIQINKMMTILKIIKIIWFYIERNYNI